MQLLINAVISSNSRCMQSQPGLIQVHKSPRANNRDSSNGRPTYNEQTKSTIALNSSGSVQSQRETSGPLSHARSQPPIAKILSQQTRGGRGGKETASIQSRAGNDPSPKHVHVKTMASYIYLPSHACYQQRFHTVTCVTLRSDLSPQ